MMENIYTDEHREEILNFTEKIANAKTTSEVRAIELALAKLHNCKLSDVPLFSIRLMDTYEEIAFKLREQGKEELADLYDMLTERWYEVA